MIQKKKKEVEGPKSAYEIVDETIDNGNNEKNRENKNDNEDGNDSNNVNKNSIKDDNNQKSDNKNKKIYSKPSKTHEKGYRFV